MGAKQSVPAVERAIAILEELATCRDPQSLASLTARLGLPKSSLLGICNTLSQGGLLRRDAFGAFSLGPRLVALSHIYLSQTNLAEQFSEAWDALATLPEETVVLSVLDSQDVVYTACKNGTRGLTFNYRIGMRLPASCTASGKALLGTLPPETVARLFAKEPLPQLTAKSLPTLPALERELAATRKRGYAVDREETREGMCCIGAPVFAAPGGTAVAALAISMLKAEFVTPKRDKVVETVLTLAKDLSQRLGGATPAA